MPSLQLDRRNLRRSIPFRYYSFAVFDGHCARPVLDVQLLVFEIRENSASRLPTKFGECLEIPGDARKSNDYAESIMYIKMYKPELLKRDFIITAIFIINIFLRKKEK